MGVGVGVGQDLEWLFVYTSARTHDCYNVGVSVYQSENTLCLNSRQSADALSESSCQVLHLSRISISVMKQMLENVRWQPGHIRCGKALKASKGNSGDTIQL